MILKKLLLFLALCISISAFGQSNYKIDGTLKDTLNFGFTQYTTVSIIRASDSLLQSFTRADEKGDFSIEVKHPGNYLLIIENPRYASLIKKLNVQKTATHLGLIPMISKKHLLKEVVISGKNAVTIKGDTVEYLADSFKTGQYDNVDALLKQLPGIEVGPDGNIKAYGKKVQKMLVDGEEFFSDDPAMVAKMLRASSVKTVQVFDKKSESAEFTGIDDGKKIKTINLQLKDNAKHGYFGKISVGGGLPDYWQNQAMLNAFKKKRKMSAYFIMSNTQTGGLGFNDLMKYSSSGLQMSDDGSMSFSSGVPMDGDGYNFDGNYSGQGLPKTWNGGIHYNNSWKGDAIKAGGTYSIRKTSNSAINNTVSKYILPDTQYFNNSHSENAGSQISHSINFNGSYKIESLSEIRISANGTLGQNRSNTIYQTQATSLNGGLINENHQEQSSSGTNQNANLYLTYRKKFKKDGRSLSADISNSWNQSSDKGFLQSDYHLYTIDSTQTINQKKENDNKNHSLGLSLNYTEPLSKTLFVLFNYRLNLNNQEAQVLSYNPVYNGSKDYTELDSLYSNHYLYKTLENAGGIRFQFNPGKKVKATLGGDISSTKYTQNDLINQDIQQYSYINFFPKVSIKYSMGQQASLRFDYSGNSQQPTISQLQPVRNNDDPLNIAVGNPDLKQSFRHSFNLNYYSYKMLSGESFSIAGNFSLTQNDIVQKQNTDISGRRTYQFVNTNGNYDAFIWSYYGRRIVPNLSGSIGLNAIYSRTNNFINNLANSNNSWEISPDISINYNLDTTLNISYTFAPSYNSTLSTIRTDIQTNYWNFNQSINLNYQLPFHFKLGTAVQWQFRQQLNSQDTHNKVFLWNVWISRAFLKDQSLVFKIYANDVLNQNVGYNRVTTAEQISESTYNTIQRYLLLSLTWNFTKSGNAQSETQQN